MGFSSSANSAMTAGTWMPWGQMEAQAPQPTQRLGSMALPAVFGS